MNLYLSRLTLNREASAAALMPLLNPDDPDRAADAHHRLMWAVFSDSHARDRDFLWRFDGQGRFFALSARPPAPSDLFLPPECKAFEPALRGGDLLEFSLRANATRSVRVGQRKSERRDVVMDLLYDTPKSERAGKRNALAQQAAETWLDGQGARSGFRPLSVICEDYTTLEVARTDRRRPATLGVLDLTGRVEVTDPAIFLSRLARGFGRGKAWGCGLMLIRRAR